MPGRRSWERGRRATADPSPELAHPSCGRQGAVHAAAAYIGGRCHSPTPHAQMPQSRLAERREIDASHRMMQVTERELQRILLDIHDGPVQHMYAALSQLDLLRRAVDAAGAA